MSCCHSSFELLLLLGTWPSACYQRVDVLSQLLDIHSAFELLLGTWPCACYQRVDVLSQLFDSSLHVGFRNYQSSPTRRARTENKKVNCYQRVDVLSQLFCYEPLERFIGSSHKYWNHGKIMGDNSAIIPLDIRNGVILTRRA